MNQSILSEEVLDATIGTILMLRGQRPYALPPELSDLPAVLGGLNFEHKEKIEIGLSGSVTEIYFGEPNVDINPIHDDEGILLGKKLIHDSDTYDNLQCGFNVWSFSPERLGIHLFYNRSHTSGRTSGPGYTGTEETNYTYKTPLRRTVRLDGNSLLLESETRDGLVEVEDIRRVRYDLPADNDTEFHILDWDEKTQAWTNSSRYSCGSHVWYPCSMDGTATDHLRAVFAPIAEALGIGLSDFDSKKLAEIAAKLARPAFLGAYEERLDRTPYPGEVQMGITPHIKIGVYQKLGGTLILLREKPIF